MNLRQKAKYYKKMYEDADDRYCNMFRARRSSNFPINTTRKNIVRLKMERIIDPLLDGDLEPDKHILVDEFVKELKPYVLVTREERPYVNGEVYVASIGVVDGIEVENGEVY